MQKKYKRKFILLLISATSFAISLQAQELGKLLNDRNWHDEVLFASQKDLYTVVPYLTKLGTIELIR